MTKKIVTKYIKSKFSGKAKEGKQALKKALSSKSRTTPKLHTIQEDQNEEDRGAEDVEKIYA